MERNELSWPTCYGEKVRLCVKVSTLGARSAAPINGVDEVDRSPLAVVPEQESGELRVSSVGHSMRVLTRKSAIRFQIIVQQDGKGYGKFVDHWLDPIDGCMGGIDSWSSSNWL